MKRLFGVVAFVIVAAVVLPPLWYSVSPEPPPPELPPAGRSIAVGSGMNVNVLDQGSGPPVVLSHGLPGSAYDWRELSPELAKLGFRAIAYDRVGYGRSTPRSDGRYTPEANAEELLALIEALELRDVTLVGWSYGGVTAMLAAMRDPARIGHLVLVGTGGPDSADAKPPEPPFALKVINSKAAMRWRRWVPPVGVALMKVSSEQAFSGKPQPDWWLDGLRANFARWDTALTYRSEMFGIGTDPSSDPTDFRPESIRLPTLILHGDDDRLAPVAIGRYLNTQIPKSRLVEYPGASHMLPVTRAREVADQIAGFVRN